MKKIQKNLQIIRIEFSKITVYWLIHKVGYLYTSNKLSKNENFKIIPFSKA